MPGWNNVIPLRGEQRGVRPSTMRPGVREGRAELEANLARRLAAGDPGAERDLLELHGGRVERILTRILGPHPDLDDLVQEVFVRAFERFDELEEPLALPAWLTSIAVFVGWLARTRSAPPRCSQGSRGKCRALSRGAARASSA